MKFLDPYKIQIDALCLKHGVKVLYAFGSVLSDHFSPESDVDFLVDLGNQSEYEEYAENYFQLADELETLLQRPVDLLTVQSLRNPFFIQQVENSKQMLYAA
jgi:predicted nucleotidyltransferase